MQIQNRLWTREKEIIPESPVFQQGDVVKGRIIEKLNSQEAMVQVGGQNIKMKFDSPIGAKKEITVQIQKMKEGTAEVKEWNAVSPKSSLSLKLESIADLLGGLEGAQKLKEYISRQLEQGNMSEQHLKPIVDFWKETNGTYENKQKTVERVLQKKLPIQAGVLQAVHEALHGKWASSLENSIQSFSTENVQESTSEIQTLVELAYEQLVSNVSVREDVLEAPIESKDQAGSMIETSNEMMNMPPVEPASQNVIVKAVTKKMKLLAQEFQIHQKETNQILQLVEKSMQSNRPQAAEPLLETVIHKLDKAILKSDFLLYADMKTEKAMLQASTLLNEAKQLLAKGELQSSLKAVQQVKEMIQQLEYKPSEIKMIHYVKDEGLAAVKEPSVQQTMQRTERLISPQEMTGRKVLELIRQMGLNREHELMDSLVFKSKEASSGQDVKSALLTLQEGQGKEKLPSALTNMLQQVTGQQLLNKHEGTNQVQNAFFRLPLQVGKEVNDVKVFITSKNKFDKMDWENCSLYFLLETKTAGDIGISLKSVNRQLSITFKNDNETFLEEAKPLTEKLSKAIHDIGFQITSVHYDKLLNKTEEAGNEVFKSSTSTSASQREGFDYSV